MKHTVFGLLQNTVYFYRDSQGKHNVHLHIDHKQEMFEIHVRIDHIFLH